MDDGFFELRRKNWKKISFEVYGTPGHLVTIATHTQNNKNFKYHLWFISNWFIHSIEDKCIDHRQCFWSLALPISNFDFGTCHIHFGQCLCEFFFFLRFLQFMSLQKIMSVCDGNKYYKKSAWTWKIHRIFTRQKETLYIFVFL